MRKQIPVKNLSEEEMIENLQQEEQIEDAIVKEYGLKALFLSISVVIGVLGVIYVVVATLIPKTSLEDIRVENLRKVTEFEKVNNENLKKAEKMVEIYTKRKEDAKWCRQNNSNTGSASDCFIFNK